MRNNKSVKRKKFPLVWRMTITNTFVLFFVLVVFSILLIGVIIFETSETKTNMLNNMIQLIEKELDENKDQFRQKDNTYDYINLFDHIKLRNGLRYSVYAQDGRCIYTTVEGLPAPELNPTTASIWYLGENPLKEADPEDFEYIIHSGKWINFNGQNFYLHVFGDITEEMEAIENIPIILIPTMALGLLVSFLAGSLMTKKMLKPMKNISTQIKNIDIKNLSERIPELDSSDELQELTQSFNKMIERLEQSFIKQNQFVSDASHELRTPLAVIQGHASMLLRWGKDDKETLETSLNTIYTEIRNMIELVEKLLTLAKSDNTGLPIKKERFAVDELLKEVVDEIQLIMPEININLLHNNVDYISGDRSAIKQILRILLDNSAKFCPPPGKIELAAIREKGKILLSVADEGIGIETEKLPYVFNRFFRVDSSRTKKTGGTGLGLAIAKSIVESHGGTIDIQSHLGKGTKISIWLPDH